jgi:hypothetical protein
MAVVMLHRLAVCCCALSVQGGSRNEEKDHVFIVNISADMRSSLRSRDFIVYLGNAKWKNFRGESDFMQKSILLHLCKLCTRDFFFSIGKVS